MMAYSSRNERGRQSLSFRLFEWYSVGLMLFRHPIRQDVRMVSTARRPLKGLIAAARASMAEPSMPHSADVFQLLLSPKDLIRDSDLDSIAAPWCENDSLNDDDWQLLPPCLRRMLDACSTEEGLTILVSFLTQTVCFAIRTDAPPPVLWGESGFLDTLGPLLAERPYLVRLPELQCPLLYMMRDLAPLPLNSDIQMGFFQTLGELVLQGSQRPIDMARGPLLAFLAAAGRACTYQPDLPVVDALLRAIPAQ
jgi:hypothetical protein